MSIMSFSTVVQIVEYPLGKKLISFSIIPWLAME
jgi:hypothetical protein